MPDDPMQALPTDGRAQTRCNRREMLLTAGAVGLLASGARPAAARVALAAEPELDVVTLLVAGPPGGRLDTCSELIARLIGRDLPPGTAIRREVAGGSDGVTAANQFEARVAPDGNTLLLFPGDAPIAWLAGDPRARFDAAGWIRVLSAVSPGVVASRVPPAALRPGARLRIAAGQGPASTELAALLAIDLLGLETVPVYGLGDPETARAALASHAVDAVFLSGTDVPAQADALAAAGVPPLFSFGAVDDSDSYGRDPLLPAVPTLAEIALRLRGQPLGGELYTAWRAAAAAAQLQFAVVLPQLTPAALVALWHRAGADAAAAPELREATGGGVRLIVGPGASPGAGAVDAAALLELRAWLATRLNWQPA